MRLVEQRGYTLLTTKVMENPMIGWSRLVVYVRDGVNWKSRPDLENDVTAYIWIEAGLGKQRPVVIGNVYREWGLAGQNGNTASRTEAS